ncbi:endonuclease/exonuclease/phosphatase family protein [Haloferula rosea]|uniref:Endonuclease/exonuclease/phosphatase family protein n=1 Tax=Haloferula rosea TaxID=490093 RepID=A0A934RFN1_9BACT|nr:endonuclease/exonuclease/phosphatase family protein [Haloferula rosea]MBK1828281.1 endonuclease/exonuclease/phosphatase family protein [Haloferula rosea]
MRAWILIMLLVAGGCRKEEPPRAVPVSLDGALELQLCSFNIRYEGDQDRGWKSWPNRLDRVLATVREIDPDVLGVQEALHGQVADLWASLPDYRFYGVGRDDGKRAGEYAGIFWKRDRFEESESGTFWLSDYPEQPGSRTWGNSVVRCTSWVRLVDRSSGRGFYVYNTHFDHRHQGSRERAAVLIAERIDARTHGEDPVVLLGDFNAVENNPAVAYFRGTQVKLSGRTVDGWSGNFSDPFDDRNPDRRDRRTLHFWSADRTGWAKVDHILVSQGAVALDAGIFRAPTQRTQPSDHFPVWARVSWPASTDGENTATLLTE